MTPWDCAVVFLTALRAMVLRGALTAETDFLAVCFVRAIRCGVVLIPLFLKFRFDRVFLGPVWGDRLYNYRRKPTIVNLK